MDILGNGGRGLGFGNGFNLGKFILGNENFGLGGALGFVGISGGGGVDVPNGSNVFAMKVCIIV